MKINFITAFLLGMAFFIGLELGSILIALTRGLRKFMHRQGQKRFQSERKAVALKTTK